MGLLQKNYKISSFLSSIKDKLSNNQTKEIESIKLTGMNYKHLTYAERKQKGFIKK